MALATSSFYGGETRKRLAAEERDTKQGPGIDTPEYEVLSGGTAADGPPRSFSLHPCKPASAPPLYSSCLTDCPTLQGHSSSTEVPNTNSVESQSPSAELGELETDPILAVKKHVDVDVTPEFSCSYGGGGGRAEEEREKTKEGRKLFPLFDTMTWTKQAQQEGHTPKGNAPIRKRRRSPSEQDEDPLQELCIKRKKWIGGVPRTKGRSRVCCYLDFGQKTVGHTSCRVCGMVYTRGLPEDEELHVKFHNSFVRGISFPGWKNERVVNTFADGRIVEIHSSDPRAWTKKVCDVCKVVDAELGYADSVPVFRQGSKAYLFISTCKQVIACVITDALTKGYRMLPADQEGGRGEGQDVPWYCSLEPEQAALGINRLWVSSHYRRIGVATRMLDTIREHYHADQVIPRELIAFSDPSPSGRKFAERYIGMRHFLVYQWFS